MYQYKAITLIVNIVSIFFLLGLSVLLLYIKKKHNPKIIAPILAICTPIPFFLYSIFFCIEAYKEALWVAPFAYSAGLAFMPSIWISTHQYFNKKVKFSKIRLLHFLPALACFIIYSVYLLLLSLPERINFILYKNTYMTQWIEGLNIIVLSAQFLIYSTITLLYIHRVKQFIRKNYTFAEWGKNIFIPKTFFVLTIAFVTLLFCHHTIDARNSWTLNIFDISIMLYFTYYVMKTQHTFHNSYLSNAIENTHFDVAISIGNIIDHQRAKHISNTTKEYLSESKVYLNPALTIKDVADAIGMASADIAQAFAINDGTHFTTIINRMRIERATKAITLDSKNEQNFDTLTYQSGFTSREAFFKAFKHIMGKTPIEFLNEIGSGNPH